MSLNSTAQAAQALVLVPVSAPLAALIHQLQGEMPQHAEAALTLPSDDAVRYTHATHREGPTGFRAITCKGLDCELSLQTPTCTDPHRSWSRPGRWYGNEMRIDAQGRRWIRSLDDEFVMDDFGSLVAIQKDPQ